MKPLLKSSIFWLAVTGLVALLGACSTAPAMTQATTSAPSIERYIIGPGDSLDIYVRDNPTLTTTVPVRPDGRISIPLVQSIMAAGKASFKLRQKNWPSGRRKPQATIPGSEAWSVSHCPAGSFMSAATTGS